MLKKTFYSIAVVVMFLVLQPITVAHADTAALKAAIQSKYGITAQNIRATKADGIYEVLVNGVAVYTDQNLSTIFLGPMLDGDTLQIIPPAIPDTDGLPAAFRNLPLDEALKFVFGNGARKLVVFEDPRCPFCKELNQTLTGLDNLTVYILLTPILGTQSYDRSVDIWCAPDRYQAFVEYTVFNQPIAKQNNCAPGLLENHVQLFESYAFYGVPAMIFADGSRETGAIGADSLQSRLDAAGDGN